MKSKIKIIGTILLAMASMTGCGSEDKGIQKKLAVSDIPLFPNKATIGTVDAKDIDAGEYSLSQVKTFTDSSKSGKVLYLLQLNQIGDLSKSKDKFSVKSKWNKAPEEQIWVTSISVDTPLRLRVSDQVLDFDREALITFQANSKGETEWSTGEQVKTGSGTLMGAIFSLAAIKENLVYKLLGKEGIAVQRSNGVSFFVKTLQGEGMTIITEYLYTKTASGNNSQENSNLTPSSNNQQVVSQETQQPIASMDKRSTKYIRCYTKSFEIYGNVEPITNSTFSSLKVGHRSRGSQSDFAIRSNDLLGSIAYVSGEYQLSVSSSERSALELFIITGYFGVALSGSEATINGSTEAIEKCDFLQNNIYSGKLGF